MKRKGTVISEEEDEEVMDGEAPQKVYFTYTFGFKNTAEHFLKYWYQFGKAP